MVYHFYDTSALLDHPEELDTDSQLFISNLTLKELEQIKTSYTKDEETKYKARKIIHWIADNTDKIRIVNFQRKWEKELDGCLTDNIDSRIILCAKHCHKSIVFVTNDLCCQELARAVGLEVQYNATLVQSYTGYCTVDVTSDAIQKFYDNTITPQSLYLLENEYFLLYSEGELIDKFKVVNNTFEQIHFPIFESKLFGKIKPKDEYQCVAMDSLKSNQLTVLRGPAGTGKSYLAMGYLFDQLESGKIDKIIIFCNTVAVAGSAKLGFYPGSRNEKLLDSQIGNFLASKLGDRTIVERLIAENKLVLLPLCDIRGYDTSNMHAGVYITEAQNLSIDLMKLALQRVGEDCICILDGDDECQVDMSMYAGNNNGLKRVSEVFRGDSIYGEVKLQNIYRSHIAELAEKMK